MKFQDFKKTLFNKNPFKRFNKHNKLYEQFNFNNNNNDEQVQIFYTNYIGNTILSYDSNEGNASSCINRIIETVSFIIILLNYNN
jgi:hypothetical protein